MTTINKFDSDLKPRVKEDTGGILPGIRVDKAIIDSFSQIPGWDCEMFKEIRLRFIGRR
jgi:hypothetical protein